MSVRYDPSYYDPYELRAPGDFEDVAVDEVDDYTAQLIEAEDAEAREFDRQARIAAGIEASCACCGCSETRACSGGCIWVTKNICSRCASPS